MCPSRRGTVTLGRARVAFVLDDSGRQAGELRLAPALCLLREYLSYRPVTSAHPSPGEESSQATVNLADITRYMWQVASIGL